MSIRFLWYDRMVQYIRLNFCKPRLKTNMASNWLTKSVVNEWNMLASHMVRVTSIDTSKKRFQNFIDMD